jgi:hypothetical protein
MDRRYLMMIADIYKGGPVAVETLAAGLSEPRDTIEEVIEPFLIQLGLVARTARGRCLNDAGWRHFDRAPPAGGQTGLLILRQRRQIGLRRAARSALPDIQYHCGTVAAPRPANCKNPDLVRHNAG